MEVRNDKMNFREELLVKWHTQFAENQRIREQSFLKILGFLGAVVLGYAFVYQSYPKELSLVVIAAISLIFFGSWQILTIAYNFRRDQYVNVQIRKYADIVGDGKVFPKEFDPFYSLVEKKSNRLYSWIPDFLLPYYSVFPFFQILIIVSYFYRVNSLQSFDCIKFFFRAFSIFVLFIVTLFLPIYYYKKLVTKLKEYNKENKK